MEAIWIDVVHFLICFFWCFAGIISLIILVVFGIFWRWGAMK